MANIVAYYLWPPVWVESAPKMEGPNIDLKALPDEVYTTQLTSGISVNILREGLFVFDFSNSTIAQNIPEPDNPEGFDEMAYKALRRVNVLNVHLACLYTAIAHLHNYTHPKMVVSPADLINIHPNPDKTKPHGMNFGDPRIAMLALSSYESTYQMQMPHLVDWRINSRIFTIDIETLRESFITLDKIIEHSYPDILLLVDLHLQASKAYENFNFAFCLSTNWTITEKLLYVFWDDFIANNRQKEIDGKKVHYINETRKKRLKDGRSFSASVVSETLSLLGFIPFELYIDISKVRVERNDWIHELKTISREDAELSISVGERMLKLVSEVDISLPGGLVLHS